MIVATCSSYRGEAACAALDVVLAPGPGRELARRDVEEVSLEVARPELVSNEKAEDLASPFRIGEESIADYNI